MLTITDEIDKDVLARVEKALLPATNSPIAFDLKVEGQRVNDQQNQFLIGPWAGPQADVSNLLHEAAHFAEREVDKLLLFPFSSWGFSYGKYWEIGTHSGYEPSTDQAVRREQRVWAYQLSTLRHFGIKETAFDLVSSVVYLSAWCFYQPFVNKSNYNDRSKIRRLASETRIMSENEYTYEAFLDAWKLRVDRLRNVTNTNGVVAAV
jgi:hypothetical protein